VSGPSCGDRHLPRLGQRVRERFLAEDVFAGGKCGESDRRVGVAGRADVDDFDIIFSYE